MSLPTFAEFFETLYGRPAFPWQRRLADEVLERGWPDLLDLPTGVGKTSALDIALYCLARAPKKMPRRTVLVVDRRIVVDQGATRARELLNKLRSAEAGPLREIASALRATFDAKADEAPFAMAVMRGGMPRDNDWARRPDQPVLGVSTVDQVGSRLLFRGYGVNPRSASIHAGLLGNDTLILLDEVHLAVPFAQTLEAIEQRYRREVPGLPRRFKIVRMSATPGEKPADWCVFELADEDRRDPVLVDRLNARKLAALVPVKASGDEAAKRKVIAQRAVAEARALQTEGTRVIGVIVNRVDTARIAMRALREERGEATDPILVTGRMRPLDRDRVVHTRLLRRAGADRKRGPEDPPLVVVATQCVEAGADLDMDGLVTECASLDALRQRFGRVDRRGQLKQTRSVILGRADQVAPGADEDPVYGRALSATWQWLNERAASGGVDFGSSALPPPVGTDGKVQSDVLAPSPGAPVLLPTHLDAWAQTSFLPSPDPDVSLWLHGQREGTAEVQVVWRGGVGVEPAEADVERIVEQLAACRPSSLEAMTLPLAAVKRWLAGQPAPEIADIVGSPVVDGEARRDRRSAAEEKVVLRWRGDESKLVAVGKLAPGDVIVVDVLEGGHSDESFDPESKAEVIDLGDLAQLRGRGIASLRLDRRMLAAWDLPAEILAAMPEPSPDEEAGDLRDRVHEWLRSFPEEVPQGFLGWKDEWDAARRAWTKKPRVAVVGGSIIVTAKVPKGELGGDPEASDSLTEDEDSSFRQVEVKLKNHNADVGKFAEQFGKAIGFGGKLVEDLALAGRLHDVGKADPRFQRWLVGGSEVRAALLDAPLAKSALPAGNPQQRREARERAGYPAGYRHELLSLEMIRSCEDVLRRAHDRTLVMHLVASHHGWCRPFAPLIDDPEDLQVRLKMSLSPDDVVEGAPADLHDRRKHDEVQLAGTTRHRLERLDSGISDRFWELTENYGWWGLAWLEAVLRLADHRASEAAMEGSHGDE
jgi:CRISPR-associated endonuclease/helicase Cas3